MVRRRRPRWPGRATAAGTGPIPHRGGRADRVDHDPLLHRGHVLRVDLGRGAREPGHRHEPHRRELEHRRGRRGCRPLHARRQRRPPAQCDQAGGVRPLRRDGRVSGQRRRPADQDLPGRQARGGRAAGGEEDLPVDRPDEVLDAGSGADLAPAASRHLFDRGHRPAHPRPQVVQPGGPGAREIGGRGRRGHGRSRGGQGPLRRGPDFGPRRRHRVRHRSPRSSTPASPGRSAWPRPSRRCWPTGCATASWSRWTGSSRPAAM